MRIKRRLHISPGVTLLLAILLPGCSTPGYQPGQINEVRPRALQGDPVAQRNLAIIYDSGNQVPRDPVEAAKWYIKSAEQGDFVAQNSLGSLYQQGDGVQKDYERAVYWYRKAAEQKNAQALNNLGYMYDMGLGVPQDKTEAAKLYQLSAEQGWPEGMLNLGVMYVEGTGVTKDYVQAYMWFDLGRFYTQRFSDSSPVKRLVREALKRLKPQMTKDQIEEAKRLGREWDAAHRK